MAASGVSAWTDMLADPNEQFDLRSELLASIAEFASAPLAAASTVPRPASAAWLYGQTESDTPGAASHG